LSGFLDFPAAGWNCGGRGSTPASSQDSRAVAGGAASLMDAMVLGEESFLRNATRTEYQRSAPITYCGFGNEPEHFGGCNFLGTAPGAGRSGGRGCRNGCGFVRVCVCGGSRPSGVAGGADAGDVSGCTVLYRERNMMNAIGARRWSFDRRSAGVVRREFSADVSGGLYHRGHRLTDFGADDVALRAAYGCCAPRVTICALLRGSQFRLDFRLIGEDCGDLSARISVWLCQRFSPRDDRGGD